MQAEQGDLHRPSLRAPGAGTKPMGTLVTGASLQNCKMVNFCGVSHLVTVALETNALRDIGVHSPAVYRGMKSGASARSTRPLLLTVEAHFTPPQQTQPRATCRLCTESGV